MIDALILSGLFLAQAEPMHETGDEYADNMYVHQWIASEAHAYFASQIEGAELGTHLGTISGSFGSTNANLLEGMYAEDVNYRDPLNQFMPYNNHFCAGADGTELDSGYLWYDSAYEQALRIWRDYMKPDYPANKPRCYYRLGHVAHLLADMTVPAHVHNDAHPLSEPYENAMGVSGRFKLYYFGCTRSGLDVVWDQPIGAAFTDLRDLFYRTTNYTEDYDSGDNNGDVTNGASPYAPGDYPATWHRPAEVSRSGGMSEAELTITADDLLPYAIRRVAELYRLFYRETDATLPAVSMGFPATPDPANPATRGSMEPFDLAATATDPESGIVVHGYRFMAAHWDGAAWSEWLEVAPAPGGPVAAFTPAAGAGLYAFKAAAENGGGHVAASAVTYLRIDLPEPTPLQAWLEAWGAGLPGPDTTPLGDMNHDGLCNFLVYVAGGNPTLCDGLLPLRFERTPAGPRPVLRLRGDDPRVLYRLGASSDLATWTWHAIHFTGGIWTIDHPQMGLADPHEAATGIWEMRLDDASGANPVIYKLDADYESGLW